VNPTPEDRPRAERAERGSGRHSLVQADSLMQIALVLPCAMLVGWFGGWCVDHFLHSQWGTATGLILGIVAGMISAIRMAVTALNSLSKPKDKRDGP